MSELRPVPDSPQEVCPVLNGMAMPPVTLTTTDGQSFDLAAAVRLKPTVLVFYRGYW